MSTSRLLHSLEMRLPLSIECRRRAPSLTGAIHCTLKTLSFPPLTHPLPLSSSPLPTIFIHTTIYRTLCSFSYRFSCLEFLTRDLITPSTATVITVSQSPPPQKATDSIMLFFAPSICFAASLLLSPSLAGPIAFGNPTFNTVRFGVPFPIQWYGGDGTVRLTVYPDLVASADHLLC